MIWYFVALLIYIVYVMIIVWITQKEGFMKSYSITKRALSMIRKLNLNTDDHVSPTFPPQIEWYEHMYMALMRMCQQEIDYKVHP